LTDTSSLEKFLQTLKQSADSLILLLPFLLVGNPGWISGSMDKALSHWWVELVDDLGGERGISKLQHRSADLYVKTHLLLQSINNWLKHRRLSSMRVRKL